MITFVFTKLFGKDWHQNQIAANSIQQLSLSALYLAAAATLLRLAFKL